MSEERTIDVTIYPQTKKDFVEQYFMEDAEGRQIQCWTTWRSGSIMLRDVPLSEVVLEKMGESIIFDRDDIFNTEDFFDFEPELIESWDQCDFGVDAFNNIEVYGVQVREYIEEAQDSFYANEELQSEYFTMFDYLEEALGFVIQDYSIAIYNGYNIEVDEDVTRDSEE